MWRSDRMRSERRFLDHQLVRGRFGRLVIGRRRRSAGGLEIDRRDVRLMRGRRRIGRTFHLTNERLRRILDVTDELSRSPGNLW